MENKSRKFNFPHIYVLLLALILIAGILTYIIPAGNCERVQLEDGREVVDPESYTFVEQNPIGIMDYLSAVPLGLEDAASIVFFILIIGGSFSVLLDTGALAAGLQRLTKLSDGKSPWVIPIIMVAFSLGGAIIGMVEESLLFIPIMISLAMALGYDSLTGLAIVFLGFMSGFAASLINPFNLGVAQEIANLPLFSGMGLRVAMYIVTVLVSIYFVMRYAKKVKANPTISPTYEIDQKRDDNFDLSNIKEFTTRDKAVLITATLIIMLLMVGVFQWDWYLTEIAALFIGMAMVLAFIAKMGFNGFAESFSRGTKNIVEGAIIVGFARGILVVLEQGNILDTILYYVTTGLDQLPSVLVAEGMYAIFAFISFIIPSGTGQAAISIPLMTPIADMVGVTRQTMVFSFQFADGVSEIITPTSGWFMAGLALARTNRCSLHTNRTFDFIRTFLIIGIVYKLFI